MASAARFAKLPVHKYAQKPSKEFPLNIFCSSLMSQEITQLVFCQ